MTISLMVTDKLAQGLVCSACSIAVLRMGGLGFFLFVWWVFLFFNITLLTVETFFTSLIVWFFSMVLFSFANSDTGLGFTYCFLRDAPVSKNRNLQTLCSVLLKVPLVG